MVNPNVLRAAGIDPEVYSGFAFRMGLGARCSSATASRTCATWSRVTCGSACRSGGAVDEASPHSWLREVVQAGAPGWDVDPPT